MPSSIVRILKISKRYVLPSKCKYWLFIVNGYINVAEAVDLTQVNIQFHTERSNYIICHLLLRTFLLSSCLFKLMRQRRFIDSKFEPAHLPWSSSLFLRSLPDCINCPRKPNIAHDTALPGCSLFPSYDGFEIFICHLMRPGRLCFDINPSVSALVHFETPLSHTHYDSL